MGKLFKHIFKKDFVDILKFILIPPVFVAIFAKLSKVYTGNLANALLGLSSTALVIGFIVAIYTVISNDYQRFYGRNAAFYSNIPVKAGQVTGARLLNFILIPLLAIVMLSLEYILIVGTFKVASWGEIWETIRYIFDYFNGIDLSVRLLLIFTPLALIIVNIMIIQASATIGSEAGYRRLGKGTPFLIFVLLEVVVNYVIVRLSKVFKASLIELEEMGAMAKNAQGLEVSKTLTWSLLLIILVSLIVTVLLYMRCVYSHNKKLSVK